MSIYFEKPQKHPIDTSNWKMFRVGDLFEITGTKTTKHKETFDKSETNCYPYITTAATNNGCCGWTNIWTEKGNVLTVDSAVLGKVFYQPNNFTASDHVEKLIPKFEMTKYIAAFLVAILDKNGQNLGYSYAKKRSQKAQKSEQIPLPVDSNGNPDWAWMDKAARDIEERSILIQAIKQNRK